MSASAIPDINSGIDQQQPVNQSEPSSGASGSWDSQNPVNVAYPSGHVVSFPDLQTAQTHSKSVWNQLQDIYKQDVAPVLKTAGREYDAAYDTLNTMPQQLYQAVTTPLSENEKSVLGIQGEGSFTERLAGHVARIAGGPAIANAAAYYKRYAQATPDERIRMQSEILANAPEGLGSSAGNVLAMRAASELFPEAPKASKSKLAPIEEPITKTAVSEPAPVAAVGAEPSATETAAPKVPEAPTSTSTLTRDPQLAAAEVAQRGRIAELEQKYAVKSGALAQTSEPKVAVSSAATPAVKPTVSNLLRSAVKSESGELKIPFTGGDKPDAPTFYSKMEKVANEKISNNASGDQILSTLRNNGVRENEISWSGIEDFLKGKPKVAKADLQQFIKENQIQLSEVNLGGEAAERNAKLAQQREKVFAENNRIWADHLRYADLLTNEEHAEYRELEEKATRTPDDYDLKWNQNHRGQWAWHDGDTQISGAYPDESYDTQARSSISSRRLVLEDLTPSERARYMDLKARDENNGATDLFNAMNEGRDVEKYVNSLPPKVREHARRFVETDRQIHEFDKQLAENNKNAKAPRFERKGLVLPGQYTNYTEKLLKMPENATFDTTKPSPEVVARHQAEWDTIIAAKAKVTSRLDQFDRNNGIVYSHNKEEYHALLAEHSRLNDERDALHDQMIRETLAGKRNSGGNFTQSHFPEDKNVLAHVRHTDRIDTEGHKLLFAEEFQSDWHQKGKHEGYQGPPLTELPEGYRLVNTSNANQAYEAFVSRMRNKYVSATNDNPNLPAAERGGHWAQRLNAAEEGERERLARAAADNYIPPYKEWLQKQPWYRSGAQGDTARAQQLYAEYKSRISGDRWEVHGPNDMPVTGSSRSTAEQAKREFLSRWNTASVNKKVPNAPFKGDWHELAVKRMLREAAEKGYDKLAWVTGDQTADRYDLSKQISEVSYDPETEYLHAKDINGRSVMNDPMKPEKIADYIGKEPADKLLKQVNDYNARHQAEISKYRVEPDLGNKGKYIVRNADGSLEMEMGPLERDYEGPTLTLDEVRQWARGLQGTQYEGQMKGILADMQVYPHYSFKDVMLANGSEGLAEILGGKFTHSRPQTAQMFNTKFDADDFIAARARRNMEQAKQDKQFAMVPTGGRNNYLIYNTKTDEYMHPDGSWIKGQNGKDKALLHDRESAEDTLRQLNNVTPTLKGLDLKVGGEWSRNLYDRKIPNFVNKYAKKWGAKVGTSTLEDPEQAALKVMTAQEYWEKVEKPFGMRKPDNPHAWIVARDYSEGKTTSFAKTGAEEGFASKEKAEEYARKENEKSGAHIKVHSVPITPAMKKSVLKEGQPISRKEEPQFDWSTKVNALARQVA